MCRALVELCLIFVALSAVWRNVGIMLLSDSESDQGRGGVGSA